MSMTVRPLTADDLARAVFSAADTAGTAVPREQTKRMVNEVTGLCGDRAIVAFADASISGVDGYIFAVVGAEAYLVRWVNELEIAFLGKLPGLRYRERTSAIRGMIGFEGDLRLEIEIEHERVGGPLVIRAEQWRVGLIEPLREVLRRWVAET